MNPFIIFRKLFVFLPFLALLTSITACKKLCKDDEPDNSNNVLLQPQNSFSCLLNGVEFKPRASYPFYAYNYVKYYKNSGKFSFFALNTKDYEKDIYIYIYIEDSLFQKGNYNNIIYGQNAVSLETFDGQTDIMVSYSIDTTEDYQIEITKFNIDSANIAGNFEFTVVSEDKSDTIQVTEGQFDIYNIIINE